MSVTIRPLILVRSLHVTRRVIVPHRRHNKLVFVITNVGIMANFEAYLTLNFESATKSTTISDTHHEIHYNSSHDLTETH